VLWCLGIRKYACNISEVLWFFLLKKEQAVEYHIKACLYAFIYGGT
jgi:hypothetical protein